MKVTVVNDLTNVSASGWNNLNTCNNPFLSHEFLSGLESHKCLDGHGWYPCHLVLQENEILGAIPLYMKTNSVGEFVFDWDWADAYQRAGLNYYPKLVSAIPFSPVSGPRFLLNKSIDNKTAVKQELIDAMFELSRQNSCSGIHILFNDHAADEQLNNAGFKLRQGCQYHWFNHNYDSFDEFLKTLTSKRRKQIKYERRAVSDQRIKIEILQGADITATHWNIYYPFYASTFLRKWGEPRLTSDFFRYLGQTMPDACLLFLASDHNEYIAGAFALRNADTLYGRHWGCVNEYYKFLHFELCYYQTMEFCIAHKLKILNAGAQGEHKLHRGFMPVSTWSNHWLEDKRFNHAISQYLEIESKHIDQYKQSLESHLAFKRINNPA